MQLIRMAHIYHLAAFSGMSMDIRPSSIHGEGVFAIRPIKAGEEFGPILVRNPNVKNEIQYVRDQFGKKFNHSNNPNAAFKHRRNSDWWICALKDIAPNEEITLDYSKYKQQIMNEYKSGDGRNVSVI